jgi:hypothetical protein
MITLYRAISRAEKADFDKDQQFRTGINTLEVKQFFQTEEAVEDYLKEVVRKKFDPPYKHLLHITIDDDCLKEIPYLDHELDGFSAITIYEIDLLHFNKCINFVAYYDL